MSFIFGEWTVEGYLWSYNPNDANLTVINSTPFYSSNVIISGQPINITTVINDSLPLANDSLNTFLIDSDQSPFRPWNALQSGANLSSRKIQLYYSHNQDWQGSPNLTFMYNTYKMTPIP